MAYVCLTHTRPTLTENKAQQTTPNKGLKNESAQIERNRSHELPLKQSRTSAVAWTLRPATRGPQRTLAPPQAREVQG